MSVDDKLVEGCNFEHDKMNIQFIQLYKNVHYCEIMTIYECSQSIFGYRLINLSNGYIQILFGKEIFFWEDFILKSQLF